MKRKTFYHLSLTLPYLVLLVTGGLTYLTQDIDLYSAPFLPNLLSGIAMFFTFSAVLWAPLYTWMVAVMLYWGRGKSADEVRGLYLLSPLLLASAMGFPALLISLPDAGRFLLWGILRMTHLDFLMSVFFDDYYLEQSLSIGLAWVFMAALSIVIGYAFVGAAWLIERSMLKRGLFVDDTKGPAPASAPPGGYLFPEADQTLPDS